MQLPAVLLNDSPSLTIPCVWRGWIYSIYLWWPQSRLPFVFWKLWRFIFNMCLLTLYMYLGFCFHNFVLFIILLFFWEKLLENYFLLAAIFHMEHNVNFLFSIVATCARMEIPVHCAFRHFSELLWLLLAGGTAVCVYSVTQSCLILCDPMDYSPQGSSVHGIILARILEWAAISSSEDLLNSEIKPIFPVTPTLRWIPYHWAIGESSKIINDSPPKLHQ